jgi:nucleoside-triphosphatase THEP1
MLILVSGPVRVGKTTLCLRLAERARESGLRVGGVLAPALMEGGDKVGIEAIELTSGETRLLARVDRDLGGVRVGPYSFDDRALVWATQCCQRALARDGMTSDLVFVDEIGKLELVRGGGLAPLIPLLSRPRLAVTVTLVRECLLDLLMERLYPLDPRVVRVDAAGRERAWSELAELALAGGAREARRC